MAGKCLSQSIQIFTIGEQVLQKSEYLVVTKLNINRTLRDVFTTAKTVRPCVVIIGKCDVFMRNRASENLDSLVEPNLYGSDDSNRRLKTEFLIRLNHNQHVAVVALSDSPWALSQSVLKR